MVNNHFRKVYNKFNACSMHIYQVKTIFVNAYKAQEYVHIRTPLIFMQIYAMFSQIVSSCGLATCQLT